MKYLLLEDIMIVVLKIVHITGGIPQQIGDLVSLKLISKQPNRAYSFRDWELDPVEEAKYWKQQSDSLLYDIIHGFKKILSLFQHFFCLKCREI